jgi:hypothetical protein
MEPWGSGACSRAEPSSHKYYGRDEAIDGVAYWQTLRVAMLSFFSMQKAMELLRNTLNVYNKSPCMRWVSSAACFGNWRRRVFGRRKRATLATGIIDLPMELRIPSTKRAHLRTRAC